MILNGFCLSWSASSRTTIGGLIEMTLASAGRAIFGPLEAGSPVLPVAGFAGGNFAPGTAGPDGAAGAPRTPRISPRLWKSVRLGSRGLGGSLTGADFSTDLLPAFGGSCINPTLSPTFGPSEAGGGGG